MLFAYIVDWNGVKPKKQKAPASGELIFHPVRIAFVILQPRDSPAM